MLLPVVMSGGSGTRLWPLSRKQYPKQFLSLASNNTMFQDTVQRLSGLKDIQAPLIVCNDEHRFIVAEQLREKQVSNSGIILEPVGRNTAPALAIAALHATKAGEDPIMLVLAADHVIQQPSVFHQAVERAAPFAEQGKLITFGIVPDAPEVGYGYIKSGAHINEYVQEVAEFVEKPDQATAEMYLNQGNYSWNSGMFMFKASVYLSELGKYRPDILQACKAAYSDAHTDLDFTRLGESAFAACPDESVDYAVMEHTQSALVIPMDAGWSDVGSWSALWEVGEQNGDGNVAFGDVLSEDSRNSYFYTNDKLVATVGVDNLVVVNTSDAVLVAHKERVQDVKKLVQRLQQAQRSEPIVHRKVYRPWGCYDSVDNGSRFQVKRITVKPGAKLSLQMHHHRAEHWIVVSGSANVSIGDETQFLTENQSAYIPIGATHRLENPGVIPLEMIEVQSGSYLGEDDIVRFEDTYGRAPDVGNKE